MPKYGFQKQVPQRSLLTKRTSQGTSVEMAKIERKSRSSRADAFSNHDETTGMMR